MTHQQIAGVRSVCSARELSVRATFHLLLVCERGDKFPYPPAALLLNVNA